MNISYPIFLVGYSGSGKSSAARKMSSILRKDFLDLDKTIETNTQKKITEIFELDGEDFFRQIEHETLHDPSILNYSVIATGGGCPCFFDNMEYMNKVGITVYLKAPSIVLAHRIKNKKFARPLLADIPDEELINEVEKKLLEREPFYSKAHITFPTLNFNPYQLLHEIEELEHLCS